MSEHDIEWIDVWKTETLKITEIREGKRSIFVLSNPLSDEVIAIEGSDLVTFAKTLLEKNRVAEND